MAKDYKEKISRNVCEKLKAIRDLLPDGHGILTNNPVDLFYVSDTNISSGWMYIDKDKASIAVDARYSICLGKEIDIVDVNDFSCVKAKNILSGDGTLYNFIEKAMKSIGLEKMPVSSNIFCIARMKKTKEEIVRIKQAAKICKRIIESLRDKVYNHKDLHGITEIELARFINSEIFLQGGDGLAFDTIVAFGENASIPHHSPSSRKFDKDKDSIILCDFGVKKKGFCVDVTRTFAFGEEEKAIVKSVAEARKNAEKSLVAGTSFSEVSNNVEKDLESMNIKGDRIHSLGHGIGIEVHEFPRFNKDLLSSMMVFTLEPGVYIPGKMGVRLEDTYAFIENKLVNLTKVS